MTLACLASPSCTELGPAQPQLVYNLCYPFGFVVVGVDMRWVWWICDGCGGYVMGVMFVVGVVDVCKHILVFSLAPSENRDFGPPPPLKQKQNICLDSRPLCLPVGQRPINPTIAIGREHSGTID